MFKVNYKYDTPGSAGPFKGSMKSAKKYKRGESIYGPFGEATVTSCKELTDSRLKPRS